uniref:Elicitin-like protein RAL2A n=1 Tax=Phytophthora ramorum TaxID=164328 RepID=Q2N0C1_PHYRM|nr:elicitin-like protein RAL2A [Phytophthora ramorum]
MKFLVAAAVAASLLQAVSAASCAVATLSKLLTDQYIDQCAADSGYSFISGVQPDPEEVAGMCASDACHSLLADVEAMNLTECTLPIGDKIYLLADLVDYVSGQCEVDTPAPTTTTPEPTTAAPTPAPTTATPAPTTAPIASCTSAQLKYLLTSTYEKQCITDTGYAFTSPYPPHRCPSGGHVCVRIVRQSVWLCRVDGYDRLPHPSRRQDSAPCRPG